MSLELKVKTSVWRRGEVEEQHCYQQQIDGDTGHENQADTPCVGTPGLVSWRVEERGRGK